MRTLQQRFELWAIKEGFPIDKDEAGSYEDDRTAAAYKAHNVAARGMHYRIIQEAKLAIAVTTDREAAFVVFFRNVEGLDK